MKRLFQLSAILSFVGALSMAIVPTVQAAVVEGSCVEDTGLNCNAKEVPLAGPDVTILDGCDFPGDTATIELYFDADSNADRYDIGIWVSTDGDPNGDGSKSGLCSVISLDNAEVDDLDSDSCGDIDASNTLTNIYVGTIDVICNDTDNDGEINVPIIMAWDQNAGGVCNGPLDTVPGTPSKCKTDLSYALPVPVPGQIIIRKETTPDGYLGDFDFTLGGDDSDTFTLSDGESWKSGTSGTAALFAGTYTITEDSIPADWSLADISCDTTVTPITDGVSIDLLAGQTVNCTFTNERDPYCGDGNVDAGEECDDGGNVDGDGCTATCIEEICGDGFVNNDGAEACDDGNMISGDGCSDNCQTEYCGDGIVNNDGAEACDDGNLVDGDGCDASCVVEICGDGVVNNSGAEACDDGNLVDGDGCDASCVVEICGDGVVNNSGAEACDDGNLVDGDGCDALCVVEYCGDGVVNNSGAEACDDGADGDDTDGCNDQCEISTNGLCDALDGTTIYDFDNGGNSLSSSPDLCDVGTVASFSFSNHTWTWSCVGTNGGSTDSCSVTELYCGDGSYDDNEQCDDGNLIDGDGCNASCILEYCGDGIVNNDGAEECDDGADGNATDGCNDQCEITTNGACSDTAGSTIYDFDDAGNSLVSSDTLCDTGTISAFSFDAHTWTWTCNGDGGSDASCEAYEAYCGDAQVKDGDEECDDGDNQDGDGCNALCVIESCGDGIVNNGGAEACDDGADGDDTDGCNDFCETTTNAQCGDANGMKYYGQDVIDENTADLCAIGTVSDFVGPDADGGYTWSCVGINGGADESCSADEDRCGDDTVDADENETCDDGDLNGEPNQCNNSCNGTTSPNCGNGTIENGEACDNGGDNSDSAPDACRTDCSLPVCGDGVVDTNEACDDGADGDDTDGCNDFCEITTNGECGDIAGTNVYDFDDQGDGLSSTDDGLCAIGTVDNFTYDVDTNSWSWDCLGDGGSDTLSCTAGEEYCGDDIVQDGEACDDGADGDDTDGCNDLCEITTNGVCGEDNGLDIYDFNNGGDALNSGSDLCDAGTVIDFVFDDNNHVWTWTCAGDGGSDDLCESYELYCGDGLEQEKEACDDGADGDDADGCNDQCELTFNGVCGNANGEIYYGLNSLNSGSVDLCSGSAVGVFSGPDGAGFYSWTCLGINGGAEVQCSASEEWCGDGEINDEEFCDDGDLNGEPNQCNNRCTGITPSSCGNGDLEDGEQCDDGQANSDTAPDACRTDCSLPVCGDNVLDKGEECDDGNRRNGDGCDSSCEEERGGGGGGSNFCGDGIVRNGEQCDDGNLTNGDGCDSSCKVETTSTPNPEPENPGGPELLDTGPGPSAIDQLKGVTLAEGEPEIILPPALFDTGSEGGLTYLQWFKMLVLTLIGGVSIGAVVYRVRKSS